MNNFILLYLSRQDVISLNISLKETISTIESCLKSHASGKVELPPKLGVHPRGGTYPVIHAMPAFISDNDICGLKWVSIYPSNRNIGLPQIMGLLILNDPETGIPQCVMDCSYITALRTSAVSGISVRYLAKEASETVGIIGCGVQGKFNLRAFKEVRPRLKNVRVYDINPDAARDFAAKMSQELLLDVEAVTDIKMAVQYCDIVLTATRIQEKPIIKECWFSEGSLGLGLEAGTAWEEKIFKTVDKFTVDDLEHARTYNSLGLFPGGMLKPYAQLGEVVLGMKPGRIHDKERILSINVGMALTDIALGQKVYQLAKANHVGSQLLL